MPLLSQSGTSRPRVLRAALILACTATTLSAQVATDSAAAADAARDSIGRRRILALPALGSAPETGFQFGVSALVVWEPALRHRTRPASLTASAMRTAKSQTRIRSDAEHWSRGNARRIAGMLQWQEFPLPYFGIGDDTPASAEEIFVPRATEATLTVQQRIAGAWYVTGGLRYLNQRITTDSAGALRAGTVTGSTGGTIAEFTAGISTDTRDNLFSPHGGHWVQLSYARNARALSDFDYGTLRLDARGYRRVGTDHIIAAQLQAIGVDGGAPFDQLALVGNSDILRGYQRGRYRDRWVLASQAEYRSPVWRRVGAVAFAGAGVAVPALDAISSARLLPTYGAGARFQIDRRQRTGLRADYGRGTDGAAGLYLGFNQAF